MPFFFLRTVWGYRFLVIYRDPLCFHNEVFSQATLVKPDTFQWWFFLSLFSLGVSVGYRVNERPAISDYSMVHYFISAYSQGNTLDVSMPNHIPPPKKNWFTTRIGNIWLSDVVGKQIPLYLTIGHAGWSWQELESSNIWRSTGSSLLPSYS